MTAPLKLADEIEDGSDVRVMAYDKRHRLLLATALRLAEADTALIDHDDDKPIYPRDGEMQKWSDERDVLIGRHRDAEDAYRAAKLVTP